MTSIKNRWENFETEVPQEGFFQGFFDGIQVDGEDFVFVQEDFQNLRAQLASYRNNDISLGAVWLRGIRPLLNYVGMGLLGTPVRRIQAQAIARLLTRPYLRDPDYGTGARATFYNKLNDLFANPSSPYVEDLHANGETGISGGPTPEEYRALIQLECADGESLHSIGGDDILAGFCAAINDNPDGFNVFFELFWESAAITYVNSDPAFLNGNPANVNDFVEDPGWLDNPDAAGTPPILWTSERGQQRVAAAAGVELTSTDEPVTISGTEAILELLQREQCILSYKTEDIITNYFDIQDRNLETIVQYNDEEVSLLVNSINRKPGLLDFFNVPTDILSFAVPKIRLFKQIINENGETSEDGEALEFRFDSFTSESSLSSITKEGMGRGHGVGIKSASWSFEGTNPEEVTSFIKFNLKLFIQNMSDLVDGVDFQDDADPARRAVFGQQKPNLLQLLAAGVGGQADSAGNSTTYTVKAQVGWELDSTIDLGAFTSRTPDEINRIKNSITSTNKWLELFLYTSDISFGQDGTIEISLDYSAGLDEQLSDDSMNILAMDLEDGEETAIQSILRARKLDAESASSDDSSADNASSADGEPERCQSGLRGPTEINNPNDPEESIPLTNAESAMLAAATDTTESDQNIFNNYNTIFNTLLNSSKVYKLYIDEHHITGPRFVDAGDDTPVDQATTGGPRSANAAGSTGAPTPAAAAAQEDGIAQENINELTINSRLFTIQQLEAIPINRIEKIQFADLPNVRPLDSEPRLDDLPEAEPGDTSNDADQAQFRAVQEAAENVDYSVDLQLALAAEYGDADEFVTIEFFRLGDLLDQIILKLRDTEGSSLNIRNREAFTFISGIYTYVDGYGARKGVNYCDILVSVEKFREFFIEKVIRKLRVNYDLKRFILDMINTFSFLAGTGACMEGNSSPIRGETRPSFSVFQAPSIDFSNIGARVAEDYIGGILPNIPFLDGAALASGYGNIIDSRMTHLANEAFAAAMESEYLYGKEQVGRLSNYFAILSSNYSLSPPEGESQQKREMFDADRGIYHIKLGADRGLLKNVNFRKDELPGRREQRMEEGGGMNLSVLREKYNAELSLFGCPFLYPGMYIYIDPSLIGLGFADQQSSIAQILGIGGYYFINKVSNSINESSEFETTLDLIWNTFGDGGVCPIHIIESNNVILGGWPASGRTAGGSAAGDGTVPIAPTAAELAEEEVQIQIEENTARGLTPDLAEQAARGWGYR